jgi:hypothetical protein
VKARRRSTPASQTTSPWQRRGDFGSAVSVAANDISLRDAKLSSAP